MNEMNILILR